MSIPNTIPPTEQQGKLKTLAGRIRGHREEVKRALGLALDAHSISATCCSKPNLSCGPTGSAGCAITALWGRALRCSISNSRAIARKSKPRCCGYRR
jgi:hypothetical protein